MNRYETYKDSGVQWLGEIPTHWNVVMLKRVAKIQTGSTPSTSIEKYWSDTTENWYTPSDFDENKIYLSQSSRKLARVAFEDKACRVFMPNTVFIIGIGATLGRVGISKYECSANQQINGVVFSDLVNPIFGAYYLSSISNIMKILANSATLPILPQSATGELLFVCPQKAEQDAIVAFLDEKTAQIDDLVAKVEREIELLKEYKQAEIARVVTKGLNPNASMKDSGINWIGNIPSHWEVKRLGSAFTENRDNNSNLEITKAYKFYYGSLVRKDEDITLTDDVLETYKKYTVIKPNDILINGLNLNYDFISQRVAISHNDGIITSAYLAITPRENANPLYYCYLLKSMDAKKLFHGMGTGIRLTLSFAELKKQFILFPPLNEQQEIVDYIDRKTTEIDRLVVELTYQVEYLKEYKQRLIADVVTGKINVLPK